MPVRAMIRRHRSLLVGVAGLLTATVIAAADRPSSTRDFESHHAPLIAITHVRVIDGTGAAPRENQTVLLQD